MTMSLLVIFYWILLLLSAIGMFVPSQSKLAMASDIITMALFVILGLKLLKPEW